MKTPDPGERGDAVRRLAADLESEVSLARAEQLAARAVARGRAPRRALPRWVAAAAGTSFFAVSLTGLGLAADGAVPGEGLYRVDRGFEALADTLGVSRDRSVERLEEVIALADRGDLERASETAEEVLRGFGVVPEPASATPPSSFDPAGGEEGPAGATTLAAPTTSAAPAAPAGTDRAATIRLAAERLLRSVREAPEERDAAAAGLAAAARLPARAGTEPAAPPGTTTTTTMIPGTTTTSVADGELPGGVVTDGGSTDGAGTTPATTTTTAPADEQGPIVLPPLP